MPSNARINSRGRLVINGQEILQGSELLQEIDRAAGFNVDPSVLLAQDYTDNPGTLAMVEVLLSKEYA